MLEMNVYPLLWSAMLNDKLITKPPKKRISTRSWTHNINATGTDADRIQTTLRILKLIHTWCVGRHNYLGCLMLRAGQTSIVEITHAEVVKTSCVHCISAYLFW
jgi:hypothetical protein